MSFEKDIEQALEIANGRATPETSNVIRLTRFTDFGLPGTAKAPVVPWNESNGISSSLDRWHLAPVIDLDGPHTYVPSDTPGHAHLYLDQRMHYGKVLALMAVLRWCGVIERGHWKGFLHRGYSVVRPPWARKHHA